MTKIIYPEFSYLVQGAIFDVYNELRHLELSEAGWEKALLLALGEKQVSAQQQVEYELRYKDYRIWAILYKVHRELGPGYMHMHYRRATQIELRLQDLPYQVKKEITIRYRGEPIEVRETRLLIVDDRVLVAPVAVREISSRLHGRFRQYAKLLGLSLGLIANFHSPGLQIDTVRT